MPFPGLTVIGERINPGFASSKKLLDARDLGGIAELARSQVAKGAPLLNVNAGTAGENDPAFVAELVRTVQSAVSVPLSIDSPAPASQEAGQAAYDPARAGGRPPIVNSVAETRWELLQLRRRHRAQVLFMASERLQDGQPTPNRTPDEVVDTARRLVSRARAEHSDLQLSDCILDVSVGPMATDTEQLLRTAVESIRRIGADPLLRGVRMSVGLSNIGIMLPKRSIDGMPIGLAFETAFLTRCVPLGLDMSLATAGRDYRVLPEGHPALDAFDAFIAAEDGFEALSGLKRFYKLATPIEKAA
ncbi:MAG: dihydropteroate synthase [Planctomycetes bacterium]|nr:dihydropteroate synthase [Planctomycetota bacterium]